MTAIKPVSVGDRLRVELGSVLIGLRAGDRVEVLSVSEAPGFSGAVDLRVRHQALSSLVERTLRVRARQSLGMSKFWASDPTQDGLQVLLARVQESAWTRPVVPAE